MEQAREVPVNVRADVAQVVDAVSGQAVPLQTTPVSEWEPIGADFKQARVKLAPGEGTLLRLIATGAE